MIQALAYTPGIIMVLFVVLGLIISSKKNTLNRIFLYIAGSVLIWQCLLFISDTTHSKFIAELSLRLALLVSMFMPYTFLLFCYAFTQRLNKGLAITLYMPILITQLLALSSFVFSTVELRKFGVHIVDPKWGYTVIVFVTTGYILYGLVLLLIKQGEFTLQQKKQSRLIIGGVAISLAISLIANFFLIDTSYSDYTILATGPSIIFFVGGIGIAIIKHRMFDIKLIVARTMGYALSIIMLATLYGVLAFNIVDMFSSSLSKSGQQVVYTLLAVVLAFTFQPLKKFFDRLTNKLFYRDAYDSQELLDGLNKILVSTLDINKLLKNSAEEINKSIRSEFVLFGIKKIEGSPQRIVGTNERQFSQQEIGFVRTITPKIRQKSIIVDELEDSEPKLREVLHKNGIALLVRLTDTPNKVQEGLGYIVLGDKKSGGQYTKQDLQVLEIIADELVIAIQNALRFEEIQNFNITLQEKVDDATKKLRSANHRLIELDQTKDDFISMASHQLRTPLTTIKGYLSMVIEGDVGKVSNKQAELLSKAFISSQQMVYLIADLLNVSRLRTGKFVIEPKETNLSDVIGGEIDQLIETAKAKGLELRFENPKNFPTLMLDETKIRQVIMNFIDNAIYYTPAGGHVTVAIQDKGESIEFTVVDDGIGVPKNEQHHLFTKFYRAGNAKKARPDGTGLGLFMAKKVIIAQGGSIIFKSQEGKGSEFGFLFDKAQLLPENYKGALHKTTS